MLTSLHLENFKAFGNRAVIPLAPITLIFGQNSSGKSSILQALNLLKQTIESRDSNVVLLPRTEHGYVDLGSFREMLFDHDPDRKLKIRIDFEIPLFLKPFDDSEPTADTDDDNGFHRNRAFKFSDQRVRDLSSERWQGVELQYGEHSSKGGVKLEEVKIFYCDIDKDEPIISFTGRDGRELATEEEAILFMTKNVGNDEYFADWKDELIPGMRVPLSMRCTDITKNENLWLEYFDIVTGKHPNWTLSHIEKYLSPEESYFFHDFLLAQRDIDAFINWMRERMLDMPVVTNLLSPNPRYRYRSRFETFREQFLPIRRLGENMIQNMGQDLNGLLGKRLYPLGPLRKSPSRWYAHSGFTPSDVGLEGELLPDLLYRNRDLLERVNLWLERLDIGYKIVVTTIPAVTDLFDIRLQDLRRFNRDTQDLRIRSNRDTTVNLLDVGYGISQLLPFIVQSLLAIEQIISIEQPEVHIHPRLQADLGDLLIESVSRRNQFLIETHSEHLVLRLMRRVREGKLNKDQVSILYVARDEEGASVYPLRLDEDGDFIDDWPDGFFPERLNELI